MTDQMPEASTLDAVDQAAIRTLSDRIAADIAPLLEARGKAGQQLPFDEALAIAAACVPARFEGDLRARFLFASATLVAIGKAGWTVAGECGGRTYEQTATRLTGA